MNSAMSFAEIDGSFSVDMVVSFSPAPWVLRGMSGYPPDGHAAYHLAGRRLNAFVSQWDLTFL
jgi:hypothetical protein